VTKVGPKTAVKWLSEYDSLDNLVANADSIKGVAGQNLRDAIPQFELTRNLITVRRDCELAEFMQGIDDLLPKAPDVPTLTAIYDRYGFRTWLRELTGDADRVPEQDARVAQNLPEAPAQVNYLTGDTDEKFRACFDAIRQAGLVAIDTETTSLNPMQARLVGISL